MKTAADTLAELAALKLEYKQKEDELHETLKTSFVDSVDVMVKLFQNLPEESRKKVLPAASKRFKIAGITFELAPKDENASTEPQTSTSTPKISRKNLSDDDILNYLSTDKTVVELTEHFDVTGLSTRLNKMLESKLVTKSKVGKKFLWKKA